MSPYDRHLEKIASMITINDEDRESYTKDFDRIRDYILRIMCSYDADFARICKGPSLFGSYSNNVRICYPSEFDVHIMLSFPFSSYIEVEEDEVRPGFVNLDFTDVMEELEGRCGYEDFYERLEDIVDYDNNYLRRSNLQNWIRDIITGALDYYGETVLGAWGDLFELEYSKRGLAHTIYARGKNYNISIDFVPAIMFGQTEWMDIRNDHPFTYKCDRWYAVPKPTHGPKESRIYAFMICNPKVEHDLLLGRQNLKVVFRLLKSLRNKYGMRRLKSYFITTAFLWEIENQSSDFWHNTIADILLHMLGRLCDYFTDRELPFFWNDDLDLLDSLYDDEIDEYGNKLCYVHDLLMTYPDQPNLTLRRCLDHFKVPE